MAVGRAVAVRKDLSTPLGAGKAHGIVSPFPTCQFSNSLTLATLPAGDVEFRLTGGRILPMFHMDPLHTKYVSTCELE